MQQGSSGWCSPDTVLFPGGIMLAHCSASCCRVETVSKGMGIDKSKREEVRCRRAIPGCFGCRKQTRWALVAAALNRRWGKASQRTVHSSEVLGRIEVGCMSCGAQRGNQRCDRQGEPTADASGAAPRACGDGGTEGQKQRNRDTARRSRLGGALQRRGGRGVVAAAAAVVVFVYVQREGAQGR